MACKFKTEVTYVTQKFKLNERVVQQCNTCNFLRKKNGIKLL